MQPIVQLRAVLLRTGEPAGQIPFAQAVRLARATDARIDFVVVGYDSAPIDLTGVAITFTVRDAEGTLILSRLCTIDDSATARGHCDLTHGDLAIAVARYRYDLQAQDSGNLRAQLIPSGLFEITVSIGLPGDTSTTVGEVAPGGLIAPIPSQIGQAGKHLSTDGADLLWSAPTVAGDVTGPAASTTVGALQGRAIASTTPTDGQALQWSAGASKWTPTTPPTGVPTSRTLTVTAPITCDGISGAHDLSANRTLAIAPSPTFAGTASADGLAATTSAGIRASGAAASSGVPMVDSPKLTLDGSYWDGAAHPYPVTLQNVMLNPTAPTVSALEIGWNGAGAFRFNQPFVGGTSLLSLGTGDTFYLGSSNEDRSHPAIDIDGASGTPYVAGDAIVTVTGGFGSDRLLTIGTDAVGEFDSGQGVLTTGTLVIKEGTIVVGAPDSGGPGFRMLRIANS